MDGQVVRFQIPLEIESPAADFAHKRPLASVDQKVALDVTRVARRVPAESAKVGQLSENVRAYPNLLHVALPQVDRVLFPEKKNPGLKRGVVPKTG